MTYSANAFGNFLGIRNNFTVNYVGRGTNLQDIYLVKWFEDRYSHVPATSESRMVMSSGFPPARNKLSVYRLTLSTDILHTLYGAVSFKQLGTTLVAM